MTLAELDALISAKPGAAAIILGEPEWRTLMTDPAGAPWRSTRDDGQVTYRRITVWVAFPGRVRVLDAGEAAAEGVSLTGAKAGRRFDAQPERRLRSAKTLRLGARLRLETELARYTLRRPPVLSGRAARVADAAMREAREEGRKGSAFLDLVQLAARCEAVARRVEERIEEEC